MPIDFLEERREKKRGDTQRVAHINHNIICASVPLSNTINLACWMVALVTSSVDFWIWWTQEKMPFSSIDMYHEYNAVQYAPWKSNHYFLRCCFTVANQHVLSTDYCESNKRHELYWSNSASTDITWVKHTDWMHTFSLCPDLTQNAWPENGWFGIYFQKLTKMVDISKFDISWWIPGNLPFWVKFH